MNHFHNIYGRILRNYNKVNTINSILRFLCCKLYVHKMIEMVSFIIESRNAIRNVGKLIKFRNIEQ